MRPGCAGRGSSCAAIVLTAHQMAGRGRGTNAWWSGAGCLTVTFVMPVEEHLATHQIPLVAGLAVRDATAQIAGRDDILIKWPNDIVVEERKLAGLLCERVHKADLIGLGLNVNLSRSRVAAGLKERITSLGQIAGRAVDLTETLIIVARSLHAALSRRGERPFAQTLERYDAYHCLIGRRVTVLGMDHEAPSTGQVEGLDSQGRLLLRTRKGVESASWRGRCRRGDAGDC